MTGEIQEGVLSFQSMNEISRERYRIMLIDYLMTAFTVSVPVYDVPSSSRNRMESNNGVHL